MLRVMYRQLTCWTHTTFAGGRPELETFRVTKRHAPAGLVEVRGLAWDRNLDPSEPPDCGIVPTYVKSTPQFNKQASQNPGLLSVWGQLIFFFLFSFFMPDLACY